MCLVEQQLEWLVMIINSLLTFNDIYSCIWCTYWWSIVQFRGRLFILGSGTHMALCTSDNYIFLTVLFSLPILPSFILFFSYFVQCVPLLHSISCSLPLLCYLTPNLESLIVLASSILEGSQTEEPKETFGHSHISSSLL